MEELKNRYGDRVHFILLYTREAHPGQGEFENISQPAQYDERLKLAEDTKRDLSVSTLILIDEMDNRVKSAYGGMPNSAYLIGTDGLVFHKQPWMDSRTIREPLEALLATGGQGGTKPPRFETGGGPSRGSNPGDSRRRRFSMADYEDAPVEIPDDSPKEIVWAHADLDKAQAAAAEAGVPVLLELHFEGCVYCARMAKGPLREARIVALSRKFVCVKIDLTTEKGKALAEELELVGTPVFAVLDPLGNVVLKHVNFADAQFMEGFLAQGLELSLR